MEDDRHPVRFSVSQVEFIQHLINEKGLDFFEEECMDLLATIDSANDKPKYSTIARSGGDEVELTSPEAVESFLEHERIAHKTRVYCSDCSNYRSNRRETRIWCMVELGVKHAYSAVEVTRQVPSIANKDNDCCMFTQRTDLTYKFFKLLGWLL